MRIGSYEVKARLGRGGMGDVYLAQHETTGLLVAIKRAREIDAGQLASLRREIYALSRLRHPGIVRLVDHGATAGQPWCALEFVDGQTLQTLLEPADIRPTRPVAATTTTATMMLLDETGPHGDGIPILPTPRVPVGLGPPAPPVVQRCLRAMRAVADALAFLHGEGIVHCDLKPANIVLRPDGTPVIIDFGLMVHFSGPHGRERLDEGWSAVGTYEYMAPERIRRELVDARADLYAVGCILYEILTGRPPFLGDQRTILRQHVATKPLLPSEVAPGVAPELDDLVMRLLEKDPRARLGYADAVAAALEAAGVEALPPSAASRPSLPPSASIPPSGSTSSGAPSASSVPPVSSSPLPRPPSLRPFDPAPRAYLYRPAFAGHTAAIRRITMEPGGLVLVGAESGAGKTRFAMEIGRALAGEMRIFTGECLPLGTEGTAVLAAPLHPLAPLLRAIADECRSQGPGMIEMLLGRRGRVLADYEPSLLDLPEVAELPPPARLSPEAAQQRLFSELAETLFAFAMIQRLVVILDDLQWADELTLAFLRTLTAETLSDQGVLLVGTYRKDEAGDALWKLVQKPGVKRVDLERLDRPAVRSIARDMLALDPPPGPLVDWLYTCSEGNPFFVAEYLRSAVEGGLLARDARGSWTAGPKLAGADLTRLPVPGTVRDLLEIRLDALAPGAQLWVSSACILGRELDREVLERVARPDDAPSERAAPSANRARLASVEELLARQILEEIPRGFRFVHDMLREVAYERIPPARRKALHLRAARALEEVYTARGQLPTVHAALAHHYGAAEIDDKTFLYLERAAEGAIATGAYVQAHALLTRLASLDDARGRPATPLARARWSRWLGEAAYALGDLTALGTHTARGLKELGHPLPVTALGWGRTLARGLARQAAAFASNRVLSRGPYKQGVSPQGVSPQGPSPQGPSPQGPSPQALSLDAATESRAEVAQMAAQLAFRYYFAGDAAGVIATSLLAVNEAEGASSGAGFASIPRGLSRPYAYLGYLTGLARLHPIAHTYFRQAAEAGRAADDPDGVAYAFTTEAVYRLCLCDWVPAERAAQEALTIQLANDNALEAELVHTILGHIEYFTGRFDASRRRFQALHATASRRHHEQHRAWGLYSMARCDLAQGRPAEALTLLHEADHLLEKLSDEASELIVDGLFVTAYLASGDLPAAAVRAARIARRIDRIHVPTVFSTVHAYVALAELRLLQWERSVSAPPASTSATPANSAAPANSASPSARDRLSHATAALRAVGLLTAFAAMFPLAKPAAQRCAARARHLLGQRHEATRRLLASAATARRLGMPHEEVLSIQQIERLERQ